MTQATRILAALATAAVLAMGAGCESTACIDDQDCDCYVDEDTDPNRAGVDEDGFISCQVEPVNVDAETEGFATWSAPEPPPKCTPSGSIASWSCYPSFVNP